MATLLDPPTDPPSNQDNSYLVKESWVLPALIRFNGEPVVSETGEIYYKFEVCCFITSIIMTLG
jgi:hypothetical protein